MGYPWKTEPTRIQLRAMKKAYSREAYALLHSMGAGKTKVAIDLSAARFLKGKMKWHIVICPSPIKNVWKVEYEKHCPDPIDVSFHALQSGGGRALARWERDAEEDALKVVTVGIEALSQGKAFDEIMELVDRHQHEGVMVTCDESSRIKNHKAGRTKKSYKIARKAAYRLILTGTPVTQGYEDLFSQFFFLDPDIIGMKSFVLYRNMYCIMGGFQGKMILGYQNQDKLMARIAPFCDIVTKEEANPELEPKQYTPPIEVDLTPQQKKALDTLKKEDFAEVDGKEITTTMALERLTRYQQIIGGFFPYEDEDTGLREVTPMPGPNPKLNALLDLCETIYESGEKAIIWARFRPELELIAEKLKDKYGADSVCEFHGGIPENDRPEQTRKFENDSGYRFMVANPTVGGMGQTWIAASKTIYYSNTYSYEDRMQSEDRNHRRGQKNVVTYYDIVARVRADKMILQALARKGDVADEFKSGAKLGDLNDII